MKKGNLAIGALVAIAAGAFCLVGDRASAAGLAPEYAALNGPMTPFRIADNLYYVGASDVTSFLIVTPAGYILLDGGFEQTAPAIIAHIRALGFDPKKIKIILNSHAHFDHAGGIAAIRAATGAKFLASAADAPILEEGGANDFALKGLLFPPVTPDRIVADGERVTLGGATITAHITAGHTKGCTTWTLPVTIDGKRENALFLCSLSVLPVYRLIGDANYPGQAADFEKSFATLSTLSCDVFLASHGSFFDLKDKVAKLRAGAKPNPFIDPAGCRAFFAKAQAAFDKRLATCKADPACGKRED
ncbi:MAG TPA: subclass B3 metallo-beta-lactamase [Rhizomicrobium sp.]|nr:subclass B3 metallo-beta-lactamase [Rhizomicrobium sp.]